MGVSALPQDKWVPQEPRQALHGVHAVLSVQNTGCVRENSGPWAWGLSFPVSSVLGCPAGHRRVVTRGLAQSGVTVQGDVCPELEGPVRVLRARVVGQMQGRELARVALQRGLLEPGLGSALLVCGDPQSCVQGIVRVEVLLAPAARLLIIGLL